MNCDNCKKDTDWPEVIGKNMICAKCIQKHRDLGKIFRTRKDTFTYIIKKLEIKDYEQMMYVTRKDIDSVVDLKEKGVHLKTTNVANIE
jgi:5-bromo-4-chloroindolyl phosphate hydrolysis protein